MKYAEHTTVPVERSKTELERLLRRYGAEHYATAWQAGQGNVVRFQIAGRPIQMSLAAPVVADKTPSGKRRSKEQIEREFAQAERQSWRALCLIVKAKLEAIESKIASLDEEFLPYLVLPGGTTVAERVVPQIEKAIRSGGNFAEEFERALRGDDQLPALPAGEPR